MTKRVNEIMLIDDDYATNYLSKLLIAKGDYCEKLSILQLADEAFDELSRRLKGEVDFPDLILLDLNMPKVNGWEFLEEFKNLTPKSSYAHTKIFIISTSMNPMDLQKAEQMELVQGMYRKPISTEMLDEIISLALD